MNAKKLVCMILVVVMCLPILASCNKGPQVVTSDMVSGVGGDNDPFQAVDYGGNEFTFLVVKHSDQIKDYYGGAYIDAEKLTGDKINDAVFNRNTKVKEKYNVEVVEKVEAGKNPNEVLDAYVRSGDFCYDAVYGWGYKMGASIPDNYFADMSLLPNVDLTKSYWSPTAIEDLKVGDSVYLALNDISMNKLEWAGFLFFNKSVYDTFQIEATFGNIYQLVREGKWTLDVFLNMIKAAQRDMDGQAGISKNDVFGLISGDDLAADFVTGLGITLTKKTDDGFHELSFYGEKLLKIVDTMNPVFTNPDYVKNYTQLINGADTTGYDDQWQYARSIFTTDHALFASGSANATSEAAFRNMESAYGIVPMPKYDENQANYVAEISHLASVFAIPATTRTDIGSMERTGHILEYMAFKSNEILLPVYYDEVLKGQRLDGDDAAMLDIIANATHYEFAKMYKMPKNERDLTAQDVVTRIFKTPQSAASTYNSNKSKLQKELNEYFTKVLRLASQQG